MADWNLKIAALRSRTPGKGFGTAVPGTEDAVLRLADQAAWGKPIEPDFFEQTAGERWR